jgi:hypothetical protein
MASSMLSRIVAVSYGIETTYGAGTPDPLFSSCNLLFRNTNLLSVDQEVVDLAELRATLTKSGDAPGRTLYKANPGHVLMGHGGAPTTFRLGKLLRMCGMIETTNASSATYNFRSSGFESGLAKVELAATDASSITALLKGVYGTAQISGAAGQPIQIDATLSGIFSTPTFAGSSAAKSLPSNTAQTMKSATLVITPETGVGTETYSTPLTSAGTPATPKFKSFTLDLGIDVQEDKDANAADALFGLILANRKPTAQLVVGLMSDIYDDLIAQMQQGLKHKVTFTHGSGVGKVIGFQWFGQISNVELQDDVGLRTVTISYNLATSQSPVGSADQELQLTFS